MALVASGALSARNRLAETIVSDKLAEASMPTRLELAGLPAPGDTLENKDIPQRVALWLKLSLFGALVTQPPPASVAVAAASPDSAKKVALANAKTVLADPWTSGSGRAASPQHPADVAANQYTPLHAMMAAASDGPHAASPHPYGADAAASPGVWPARTGGFTTDELPQLVAEQLGRHINPDPFARHFAIAPTARDGPRGRSCPSGSGSPPPARSRHPQQADALYHDGAMDAAVVDSFVGSNTLHPFFGGVSGAKHAAATGSSGFRRVGGQEPPERAKFISLGQQPAFPPVEAPHGSAGMVGFAPYTAPDSAEVLARHFQDRVFRDTSAAAVSPPNQSPAIRRSTAETFSNAKGLIAAARSELGTLSVMASTLSKEVGRHHELLEMLQYEAMQRHGEEQQAAGVLAGLTARIAQASSRLERVDHQTAEMIAMRRR